ncbi:MAG: anthranilate phosphoribosyltransferase [Opitutaceae bacterium]
MPSLEDLTERLADRHSLLPEEVAVAAEALSSAEVSDGAKAAFLTALAIKGETVGEVAAFAKEFRLRSVDPGVGAWAKGAIDLVGTGGDHAGGFNVSSLVVLVVACAGIVAMKHGNRGITSRCGSADLMAGLGVRIEAPPDLIRASLENLGFAYFFAPAYHPAFKHINPVRKSLAAKGQRTVFNILGPLLNPGRPAHIVLGVYAPAWVPRLAAALGELGTEAGLVVYGEIGAERGIDELTTATSNHVCGVGRLRKIDARWRAEDFGLASAPFADLLGGDLEQNLAIVEAVLSGKGPRGLVDTIVLNAALAMWVCGRRPNVKEGIEPARELLLGGDVRRKIEATRNFFQGK